MFKKEIINLQDNAYKHPKGLSVLFGEDGAHGGIGFIRDFG